MKSLNYTMIIQKQIRREREREKKNELVQRNRNKYIKYIIQKYLFKLSVTLIVPQNVVDNTSITRFSDPRNIHLKKKFSILG